MSLRGTTLAPARSAGEQSPTYKEMASGEEQVRPRNDILFVLYVKNEKVF